MPHLLLRVWISPLRSCRSMNARRGKCVAGAAARREFRIPPKTPLSLGWNVPPSTPSKTRPVPSSGIAVSRGRRAIFIGVKRPRAKLRAVTEVSYVVQFLLKGTYNRGRSAGSPTQRRRGLPRARPPFFRRAPGVSRCAAPVQPTVAIHGRSDSVLGVTRHRSDLPLVKRAGLDQSKQPRTAIEAEFVERVARGHGIKAPLPFEYDLNSGQRTFFFD